MDIDDLGQQLLVGELSRRRLHRAFALPVVGRGSDTEDPQYELDRVRAGFDEAHDHIRVWPSSEAKYALAERKMSLTRSSSATCLCSRLFSSARSSAAG
ncbi:hypothetical protein [Nocardia sp. NPDC057353]|uniref:hypothetical protein n=1 Tax=Nocardia sp. NPDC057353 TaxID=3346104 RepID=UPI00363DA079